MKILVLHGPNLNLLGQREPTLYGRSTLARIEGLLNAVAVELGVSLAHFQSNSEGALVDQVQEVARQGFSGVVVNAGAYTHTSVALRDAFLATELPFVEVHLSNVHAREAFRHKSFLADVAVGVITGLGPIGYELALRGLVEALRDRQAGEPSGTAPASEL
jgi:3-dehydroquinate dehydratase-2